MSLQTTGHSTVCLTTYQRNIKKRFTDRVRGIHRWSVNSLHKGPVMREKLPFDDAIMNVSTNYERYRIGFWKQSRIDFNNTRSGLKSFWLSVAIWRQRSGSSNGLLSDGTKLLAKRMLTGHQWGLEVFPWGQFHSKCSRYSSQLYFSL